MIAPNPDTGSLDEMSLLLIDLPGHLQMVHNDDTWQHVELP